LKCNVDATFHNNPGRISDGWYMRNNISQFVTVTTVWIQGKLLALAMLEAKKDVER
jgi:hypothetical protein